MVRQKHIVKAFLRSYLQVLAPLTVALFMFAGAVNAAPSPTPVASPTPGSQADVTTTVAGLYSKPCQPYGNPHYAFGQFVSGWGYHAADDVCNAAGAPVYAAGDGQVMYSAKTPDSYRWGNLVAISHQNPDGSQVTSIYGHLSADRRVAAGQRVAQGQLIGFVGPSYTQENGNWGAHLHFGFRGGSYGAGVGAYAPGLVGYVTANRLNTEYYNPVPYMNSRSTVFDYIPAGASASGENTGKNSEYDVTINLVNKSSTTWRVGGANPVRLGTIAPNDRGSGFSVCPTGYGWISGSRIAMVADTPPGGTAQFKARFCNGSVPPGTYAERFAPLVEGVTWMADKGIRADITVNPARYAAAYVGQIASRTIDPKAASNQGSLAYMTPGQKYNVKAYIRNTGDMAWSNGGPNPVRLGTSRPVDRPSIFATGGNTSIPNSENWPAANRASELDGRYDTVSRTIVNDLTIEPGEVAAFSFTITAPNQPGTYSEYFQPIVEGASWMNDLGMYYAIRVLPPGHHYEYVSQDNPAAFAMGATSNQAAVYLRNTGQSSWPLGGNVRLGAANPLDRPSQLKSADWVNVTRASAIDANHSSPGKTSVDAGEVAKFSFSYSDPNLPDGTYNEYFRPVVEGVTWMPEDYGIFVPAQIASPDYGLQWVDQRSSKDTQNLRYGDRFTSQLSLRNIGNKTWSSSGPNPVKLGTSHPNDRSSIFAVGFLVDPNNQWVSPNRPTALDGKLTGLNPFTVVPATEIKQGEVAYYTIPMHVPISAPGTYNEYFNLVAEGATWFFDWGIYFPLRVVGP